MTDATRTERKTDLLTFGETMLRLSPPGYGRMEEAVSLDVRIGGSESNTAVALARLGLRTAWSSKLPDNALGRRIENEIRRWGVDTTGVLWDSEPSSRAGLYFVEFGVAPRPIEVTYDRARSAISHFHAAEIDREAIANARLLHLTGITTALSPNCAEAVGEMMRVAKSSGTALSFDVNHRARLWTSEQARKTLEPLLPMVDVLLCPQSDAELLFGLTGTGPAIAREFRERYGVGTAVITCGGEGAFGCLDGGECAATPFPLGVVVDRVGAGDAFNAGVLMGWLEDDLPKGLQYGMAMAALKHTIPGDLLLASRSEIEHVLAGASSGIRR